MVETLKNLKYLEINNSEYIYSDLLGYTLIDEKSSTYIHENVSIIIGNLINGLKFLSELKILQNITVISIDKCIDINEIKKYKDEFVSLKTISNYDGYFEGQKITQSDLKMLLINFSNIETLKLHILSWLLRCYSYILLEDLFGAGFVL